MAKRIQLPDGSIGEFPDDMPDEEIASVLTEQFPPTQQSAPTPPMPAGQRDLSLSEVPAAMLRNAPSSAKKFAGDVWDAVSSPLQTAKGLRDVAGGGLRNLVKSASPSLLQFIDRASSETPEELARREDVAGAAGQFLKDRYGGWQEVKNTVGRDPIGAMGDLSTIFTGGAMAAPKAGVVANTLTKAARLTDPLNLAVNGVSGVSKVIGNASASIAGNLSGAGGDAIKAAYEAGQEGGDAGRLFRENMRNKPDPAAIVETARENLDTIRQKRSADYQANSAGWTGADAPVSFAPVEKAFNDTLSSMQYRGKFKVGAPQQAVLSEIESLIQAWKADPGSHSVVGLDALKQRINDIPYDRINAPSAGRAITKIRDAISREIRKAAPDYAKTMDSWGRDSKKIEDLTKSLSLGDKASADQTLRKLTSVLRNNVNTNFGKRAADLDLLVDEGGRPLMPQLAGQTLNTWMPRGIQNSTAIPMTTIAAGTIHPAFIAAISAESPRLVGEIAHGMGRAARWPSRAASVASPVTSAALRAGTPLQSLGDLYTEDEALQELKRRRRQ